MIGALDVLDWRRRVHALYAAVRDTSERDPAGAREEWAAGRDELVRTHPASPVRSEARAGFAGLRHAAYDPALRFVLPVDPDVEPRRIEVPTATDGVVPFVLAGRLHLPLGDLDVWWLDSYGGGVFVPVKDASAGRATYGGGRYLLDTVKGADLGGSVHDALVVDLNFAYNPSCAYDPAWTCPLAPPGNTLAVDVAAGELIPPE
ncbi:DUF1684 domain-containing protein [Jiangella anatolica]|uniref:DUF1684 domain-containing protein n=1 Tax=Jiangella anatolica TaxID=2670374 RepID=A0A2W2B9L6_9ACTN|nr:DUF1684 domain-containing protein [Jiangella anatolica]PZF81840.1 hypothetical protein C1I92_19435 [Jiangella anatolica]